MRETIRIGQTELVFLATGEETAGQVTMFELSVAPQARVPVAHHHLEVEEIVYGLEGVLTYTAGGVAHELRRGDHLVVPRGTVHHFCNLHAEPAVALIVMTPALIGPAFFREVAGLVQAGPPDPKRVGEVMLRHGLVPAP